MNVPLATPVETERAPMWLAALSAVVMKDLSQAQWWIVKVTCPLYYFFLFGFCPVLSIQITLLAMSFML